MIYIWKNDSLEIQLSLMKIKVVIDELIGENTT